MSLFSLNTAPPPAVAIELANRRVTVVELGRRGKGFSVVGYASEALADGVIMPAPTGSNISNMTAVGDALKRALARAGVRNTKRAALVVPDSVARVSLLTFEQLPARTADVEQLIRWQLKKSTPYPIEEAQVTWFEANKGAGTVIAAEVARRDVIAEYESAVAAAGVHPGLVDLASFNVMNAVIGAGAASASDWLLVVLQPEATTLALGRGQDLMFYRHREAGGDASLSSLVHQTAMYHEDRLGGTRFSRVWLCGAGAGRESEQAKVEIQKHLGVPVESVDVRPAAELGGKINASADVLDALAAPVGVLLRDRKAAA